MDARTAKRRRKDHVSEVTNERLGNLAGMATSYGQLGILAQDRGDYDEAEARYRQSLEINERLGNLADMAASYHGLGTLAQAGGDYDEAEARYRRSLEIDERLGNLAGMATGFSQVGNLQMERGDDEQAVGMHVRALALRLRVGVPEAARNVAQLSQLRRQMGLERFSAALGASLDEQSTTNLLAMLDDYESDENGEGSTG